MKFLKQYYSELFSFCVFFPLLSFGISSGIISGIVIAGILVISASIIFRNNKITVFSGIILVPLLILRDLAPLLGIGSVVLSVLASLVFYLFSYSCLHKKSWILVWYCVIWLWGFELFNGISVDVFKIGLIFLAFYSIAHLYLSLGVTDNHEKTSFFRFFALFFTFLLFEFFWVIRVFPLGVFWGPMVITVFFYFFAHCYRGHTFKKPFRYYIRSSTFTFLLLLVILLTAMKISF